MARQRVHPAIGTALGMSMPSRSTTTLEARLPASWRVHVATADTTCVRLVTARVAESDPWPLTAVISAVTSLGATRADRPHAVGRGRGIPLIHRQEMIWLGCELVLEAHHHMSGADEVSLALPPWDELCEQVGDEESVWTLVDEVAAAASAEYGAIGDGEALQTPMPAADAEWNTLLSRHCGVLVRGDVATRMSRAAAFAYCELPLSGLTVMLR